jgi:DNA polymerase V
MPIRLSHALKITKPPSKLQLPIYSSSVPAGFPSPADDHIEGRLDLNEHLVRRPAATFFVRVSGHSMRDAGIFDGDLLVIDRSVSPKSDDIVIASIHGELTVKRLQQTGNEWRLAPANPDYPTIKLDSADNEIWGVVTHSIRQHCGR